MVTRTFIDKCTTIFRKSEDNFGLNPVIMLNHGLNGSRGLLYFKTEKIKEKMERGEYPNRSLLKHTLTMYNCGSIDMNNFNKRLTWNVIDNNSFRAVSFTLIAFRVPNDWDAGNGFDNSTDMWTKGRGAISFQACNWFNSDSAHKWEYEGIYPYFADSGVTIAGEYDKFLNGEESLVVASQHFEHGNEDLCMDLTNYVNAVIDGTYNDHGLCICFSPDDVQDDDKLRKAYYVGFFNNNTNTFYEPFLETRYDEAIYDSRNDFHIGVENKLYLYSQSYDSFFDLDATPTCTIDGVPYPVTRQGIGIYYATVKLDKDIYEPDTILTDIWSNIVADGEAQDDVEMEFVTKPYKDAVSIGKINKCTSLPLVVVSGVKEDERLKQGEERCLSVIQKLPYTGLPKCKQEKMWYRLYVHDAYRETDVINWDGVNVTPDGNYFKINTSELLPAEYHIDIKIGNKIYDNRLVFKVVNNSSSIKR